MWNTAIRSPHFATVDPVFNELLSFLQLRHSVVRAIFSFGDGDRRSGNLDDSRDKFSFGMMSSEKEDWDHVDSGVLSILSEILLLSTSGGTYWVSELSLVLA